MNDPGDLPADFDPMAMFAELAGHGTRVQAVFIGPPPPSLQAQVNRFLADGTGPLTALVEEFTRRGHPDPAEAVRGMFAASRGVCVIVVAGDHGALAFPQLWFASEAPEQLEQLVAACGGQAGDPAELRRLLALIPVARTRAPEFPGTWPRLLITLDGVVEGNDELREAWLAVAAGVVQASQSALGGLAPAARERLTDLAWWTAQALGHLEATAAGGDAVELAVQCCLIAGDVVQAGAGLDRLVAEGSLEDLVEPLNAFVEAVLQTGQADAAARWLAGRLPDWDARLGPSYETAQALFRCQVSAMRPTEEILPTVAAMARLDRKAMRQDLTREPVWQVTVTSGKLLDPTEAAVLAKRSTVAIVKRMDSGTIPWLRHEGTVRIPEQALLTWVAIMEAQGLTT